MKKCYLLSFDSCSLGNKTFHFCKKNKHNNIGLCCLPVFLTALCYFWLAYYLNQRLETNIFLSSPSNVIITNNQKPLPIFLPHQGRFCIMPFLCWVKRQQQSLLCIFPTAANAMSQTKRLKHYKKNQIMRSWKSIWEHGMWVSQQFWLSFLINSHCHLIICSGHDCVGWVK